MAQFSVLSVLALLYFGIFASAHAVPRSVSTTSVRRNFPTNVPSISSSTKKMTSSQSSAKTQITWASFSSSKKTTTTSKTSTSSKLPTSTSKSTTIKSTTSSKLATIKSTTSSKLSTHSSTSSSKWTSIKSASSSKLTTSTSVTSFKSTTTSKPVTTPTPTNLLTNGDFETGTDSSWYVSAEDTSNYKVSVVPSTDTVGPPGNWMLELTTPYNTEFVPYGAVLTQGMNTVPGVNYSIGFDLHFGGDGGQLRMSIDDDMGNFATFNKNFTGWKHVTGHFVANVARSHFNIEFYTLQGIVLCDFDNIVVQPVVA